MSELTRRNFMKGAGIGAATLAAGGVLAACSSGSSNASTTTSTTDASATTASADMLQPTKTFDSTTGHNFSIEPDSLTTVGTTLENLKSAVQGETNATTKYAAWAKIADKEGYSQISRLFNCTSDAEKIHINLEVAQIKKVEPDYTQPEAVAAGEYESDMNLIHGAQGEIYETSDMYPNFIKVAATEGDNESLQVFTRAKLAEAFHAQRYMDAYNTIDTPSDDKYYLCPVCGYIHKGENFTACPICLTAKDQFKEY